MRRRRVVILGAAGRDFHNFNLLFRDRPEFEVVAFTATQIPDIEGRTYPRQLAGSLYPEGIPIVAEERLERLLAAEKIDEVWLSYSDSRTSTSCTWARA
jgi:predicted GTPase